MRFLFVGVAVLEGVTTAGPRCPRIVSENASHPKTITSPINTYSISRSSNSNRPNLTITTPAYTFAPGSTPPCERYSIHFS